MVGSAIGLQLLFGIPLVWGCLVMCADVLAILYLQNKGFRYIEALVVTLIGTISLCFAAELFWSKPSLTGVLFGFVPSLQIVKDPQMLYVAIGIIGATVMPHNLYLHSSIVQTRNFERTPAGQTGSDPLCHHRFDHRADARALCQRGDSRGGGSGVSLVGARGCGADSGRVQAAESAAWRRLRQRDVCAGAARLGPKTRR